MKRRIIVLIHGLWVTPSSWEPFKSLYESLGHQVLAPPWPGITGDAAAMRRNPGAFGATGAAEVIAHYAAIIRALPEPPVIIGHSYGGLIAQILIDRGLGAAGVVIDSVPPKGVLLLPPSTYLALLPAFLQAATWRGGVFLFTFREFWRVFANTLTEPAARAEYERHVIPAPGRAILQAALANFNPRSPVAVNFRNQARSPLLVISGEKDVIMPASLNPKNFRKYNRSSAVTEFKTFPGRSHYIIAEEGWREVARHALDWAEAQMAQIGKREELADADAVNVGAFDIGDDARSSKQYRQPNI